MSIRQSVNQKAKKFVIVSVNPVKEALRNRWHEAQFSIRGRIEKVQHLITDIKAILTSLSLSRCINVCRLIWSKVCRWALGSLLDRRKEDSNVASCWKKKVTVRQKASKLLSVTAVLELISYTKIDCKNLWRNYDLGSGIILSILFRTTFCRENYTYRVWFVLSTVLQTLI